MKKAKQIEKQEIIIKDSKKLSILSTTSIINDLVKEIGGERVVARALMGPGIDPHAYRAKEEDARLLFNSEIIFYNGLNLEAKLGNILKKLGEEKQVYAIADGITKSKLIQATEYEYDPHIWFSIDLWKEAAQYVKNVLSEVDKPFAEYYASKYQSYLERLSDLSASTKNKFNQLPKKSRVLVTGHDAFSYFGRFFDFRVRSVQGVNTLAEASIGDIENLANFLIDNEVKAVFIETSISKKNLVAVQGSVFNKGHSLFIGGKLFADSLGTKKEQADSYISMFERNVDSIVFGLSQ